MSWKSADALGKAMRQCTNVVRFGTALLNYAFLDLLIQQRFLLLSHTDRVLPQTSIDVLRGNHRGGFFTRNGRAFAYEWLIRGDHAGEDCQQRQQRTPG